MSAPTTPPEAPSRLSVTLSLVVAVLFGAGVALQSRVNGALGAGLHDGFVAAVISFGSGLVIIAIALAFSRAARNGVRAVRAAVRAKQMPWFFLIGGLGGGFFVLAQSLVVDLIGVALFTVAAVAGQTVAGLAIDRRGIGTVAPKPVTVARLVGTIIALVAVGISVGPQLQSNVPIAAVIAPLIVGLMQGVQQAFNGQVKSLSGSAITATFFNFVVGTALLVVILIVNVVIVGWPKSFPTNPLLYTGGIVGVIFIAGFAYVIPILGVLLQSLCAVAGQLLMSLLLSIIAPASLVPLAWTTVIGTLLTLVGVVVASLPKRRAATAS